MMRYLHVFVLCAFWVTVSCTPVPPPASGDTLFVDDRLPDVTHTLTITIKNATTGDAQPVSGTLRLTSSTTAAQRTVQVQGSGNVTPNWLLPFGGRISVMTTPTHTWQLDGDCLRDGSMLPTISMRDVLGPLTGFAADGTRWTSTTGGAAWQQFAARAQRSSNGAVTAMSGHGIGKILLPGGVVVRGDVTWEYTTQTHPAPDVLPSRCADVIFADLPLPDSWYNRRPYGGAFLAENDMPLARATSELVAFLPAHGWDAHISQRSNQSIVIQASRADETIQLFLVSNNNDGVELTAIVTP